MANNGGWVAITDQNTGQQYYANMQTRETTWTKPPGFVEQQESIQYSQQQQQPDQQFQQQQQQEQQQGGQMYDSQYGQMDPQQQEQQIPQNQNPQMAYMEQQQQGGPMYGSQYGQMDPQQQQQQQMQFQQQQQQGGQMYGSQYGNVYNPYEPQQQQQQALQQQQNTGYAVGMGMQNLGESSTKWRMALDEQSGKNYWYHMDTKETSWEMPQEIKQQMSQQKRMSAQMAISTKSMVNFKAAWGDQNDPDDEQKNQDNKNDDPDHDQDDDDEDEEDSSSSNDGLQVYNANNKNVNNNFGNSNVKDVDDDDSSDDDDGGGVIGGPGGQIGDKDEVVIEDTSHKYLELAEDKSDKLDMVEYGDKNFQHDKHKKVFSKITTSDLLKYAPYKKVNHAIRKMDGKMDRQAQQTWKNICSYIGARKSGKDDSGHVEKLLRFALKAPEELRDEIFIQLVKQSRNNGINEQLVKTWKLISIACSIFPPSDEFAKYLACYLFKNTKINGQVGEYAKFALDSLDRTMEVGQRRVQPIEYEIERIEQRAKIAIKIYFLDGSFKTLLISSQTRAKQIEDGLGKVLQLVHPESFALFEMEEPDPGWEQQVYSKRAKLDRQQKIDDLQHMPYNRELETNERVMDVISSWARWNKKKQRTIRLVYRCKLHSKAQEVQYSKNGWKIAFLTISWHLIHGMYPMDESDALIAAALKLQAQHGVQKDGFYAKGILVDVIEKYVPWQLVKKFKPSELESNILKIHVNYKHLDKNDCYRKYLDHLRKASCSVYFGNEFFRCVRVSRVKKANPNEKMDLVLGISENGVLFLEPVTRNIIERYKMEEILTYGFRSNAFLFVAGTLMTQRKYQFATMFGKQMNDLLRSHIDLRVQQAEVHGYQLQNPQ